MDNLKKSLPKIVLEALKDEDEITRRLVMMLLEQVYKGQGKVNLKTTAQKALDDNIDAMIKMAKERRQYGI